MIEYKSLEEQKKYQEAQLPAVLNYINQHSTFYSELFKKHSINISEINLT